MLFPCFWHKRAEKLRKSKKIEAIFSKKRFLGFALKHRSKVLFPEKHIFRGKNVFLDTKSCETLCNFGLTEKLPKLAIFFVAINMTFFTFTSGNIKH